MLPSGASVPAGSSRRTRSPSHCQAAGPRWSPCNDCRGAGRAGAVFPSQYSSKRRSNAAQASRGTLKAMRRAWCTSARSNRSTRVSAVAASISSLRPARTPAPRNAPANRASRVTTPWAPSAGSIAGCCVLDKLAHRLFPDRFQVVLVLEQATERRAHRLGVERGSMEAHQGLRPVESLGDARKLAQLAAAQLLHESRDRAGKLIGRRRHLGAYDAQLLLDVRVLDVEIEAAPLQRVADAAGAVRRQHHEGRVLGADGAELRDGDLEIRQHLQQERFESLVRAIDLVDEQHGRPLAAGNRPQQRALEQVLAPEDELLDLARAAPLLLRDPEPQQLALIVPLVECRIGVEAFVALQPDQLCSQ